ncbi:hypothetical protein [Lactococcus lactis]|uniref:hypothetical protein n=1 Tax=Lactococcus lactis TaxID=1358 RepID=UPI00374F7352
MVDDFSIFECPRGQLLKRTYMNQIEKHEDVKPQKGQIHFRYSKKRNLITKKDGQLLFLKKVACNYSIPFQKQVQVLGEANYNEK